MMKKIYLSLLVFVFLLPSCEKGQLELEGTIKGTINAVSEVGTSVQMLDRFEISLEEADHAFVTWTDTLGAYDFENIPPGTYNLVISKDGFYEWVTRGLQIVGGDEPLYLPQQKIVGLTTTKIDSISLNIVDGKIELSSESVYHEPSYYPYFYVYIHTDPDPSSTNFLMAYRSNTIEEPGAQFGHIINSGYLENAIGNTAGTRIYVVVYSAAKSSYTYFDYFSKKHLVYGLSEASNIASIVLP